MPLKMQSFYVKKPCSDLMLLYLVCLFCEQKPGSFFFCNYLLCKLRLWLCVMMSPMIERDMIVFSPHNKKG